MDTENVWHLKSAWLESPSTVNKLLREGYEPFWGYRVVVDNKPKIRMYFRKPPSLVLAAITEARQTEPVELDFSQLDSILNNFGRRLEDIILKNVDERVSYVNDIKEIELMSQGEYHRRERIGSEPQPVSQPPITTQVIQDETDGEIQEEKQNEIPAGDGYRVVRDDEPIPVITTANRTPQQEQTLEALKKQHGSISILPGNDESGSLRVMAGASLYTVGVSGNFTEETTGARTSAIQ